MKHDHPAAARRQAVIDHACLMIGLGIATAAIGTEIVTRLIGTSAFRALFGL